LEQTRKAVENAEEVGLRLDKGVLTRNDALKDLANVADKLKAQLQDLGKKNPSFKALEHAARDPKRRKQPPAAPPIRSKWTTCKRPSAKRAKTRPRWTSWPKKCSSCKRPPPACPRTIPPPPPPNAKNGAKFVRPGRAGARFGPAAAQPRRRHQRLAEQQDDNFQKDMDLATTDLEKTQQMSKELQKMQEQADHEGKDLPEQLKLGQPELAQQTLNKMIEKVRSGKMTPEEAAKFWTRWPVPCSRLLPTATPRNFCTRPPSNCAAATNRARRNRWPTPPRNWRKSRRKWPTPRRCKVRWTL
jgi:hypothetical protein